jgi:ABC-type dipeptide/oligopeptide/nickel transport system permease component
MNPSVSWATEALTVANWQNIKPCATGDPDYLYSLIRNVKSTGTPTNLGVWNMGVSIPSLVLAPVFITFFALRLGWFPVANWGAKPPYIDTMFLTSGFDWVNYFMHAFLPVVILGTGVSAIFARLMRASLLQIIREDYIRTARSKGLAERWVIYRHALKNSLIPVATVIGPIFAAFITGTLIVEQFFGLNGMGKLFVQSIQNRDYAMVLGTTLIYSVILVFSNLAVDLTYAFLDPRIRLE